MAVKRTGGGGRTDKRMSGGRTNIQRAEAAEKQPGRHGGGGYVPKNQYTGGGSRTTFRVEARERGGGRDDYMKKFYDTFNK